MNSEQIINELGKTLQQEYRVRDKYAAIKPHVHDCGHRTHKSALAKDVLHVDFYLNEDDYDVFHRRYSLESIAVLLARCERSDANFRCYAGIAFAVADLDSQTAVKLLRDNLKSPDAHALLLAMQIVMGIHPQNQLAEQTIIAAAQNPAAWMRCLASYGLWRISSGSSEAGRILLNAPKDSNWRVRYHGAICLGRTQSVSAAAVPILIETLKDSVVLVQHAAVKALGEMGYAAMEAIPALIDCVPSSNYKTREHIAKTLGHIGTKDVIPCLLKMIADADCDLACASQDALEELGEQAVEAVPAILEYMKSVPESPYSWIRAGTTLARIDPYGEVSLPAISEFAKSASVAKRRMLPGMFLPMMGAAADLSMARTWDRGTNTIPYLDFIRKKSVPVLLELLQDPDTQTKMHAISILRIVRSDATAVIRLLKETAESENVELSWASTCALWEITADPKYMQHRALRFLNAPELAIRIRAAKNLVHMNIKREKAMAVLLNEVHAPNPNQRLEAAKALVEIEGGKEIATAVLDALLQVRDAHIRSSAAEFLIKTGLDIKAGLSTLLELLEGPCTSTQLHLEDIVSGLGPEAKDALPILLQYIKRSDYSYCALTAILKIGVFSKEVLAALNSVLKKSSGFANQLAVAIMNIDPKNKLAVRVLSAERKAPEDRLLWLYFAINTISALDAPEQESILACLTEVMVKEPDKYMRIRAAIELFRFGREKALVLAVLLDLAKDANVNVRTYAAESFIKIAPGTEITEKALIYFAEQADAPVRIKALEALANMGVKSERMVRALRSLLNTGSRIICCEAINILGRIGPAAKEAVPALILALNDPAIRVRYASVLALGKIGPLAKEAVPELFKMLKESDVRLRHVILDSMDMIQGDWSLRLGDDRSARAFRAAWVK